MTTSTTRETTVRSKTLTRPPLPPAATTTPSASDPATRTTGPTPATAGTILPLDAIQTAGVYLCDWSGHLLRVPPDSLTRQGALAINLIGDSPLTVTLLSSNPFLSLSRAREVAASLGRCTAF